GCAPHADPRRGRRRGHPPRRPSRPSAYHGGMTSQQPFPDASGTLTLPGPTGALEVAVDLTGDDVARLPATAIVCHPLPTEGGTMHNKVVTMAARALRESGLATVRFNFRGTGASEGTFDGGEG